MIALAPVMHLVPLRHLAAERFLYVAMIGVAIAAGGVAERL